MVQELDVRHVFYVNMKKPISLIAACLSGIAAYVLLTLKVSKTEQEGSTLIVPSGTAAADIEKTASLVFFAGIFWAVVAIFCTIWMIRVHLED